MGERQWVRLFVAIAAIGLLAGCVPPPVRDDPSLVSRWAFQPPRRWANMGNQTWRSMNPPQLISLHVLPARRAKDLGTLISPYDTSHSQIVVCRGVPALFARWRPWFGRMFEDEVLVQRAGSVAIAGYYYPRTFQPDVEAERSLRTVCPKET